jgi:energy-coupling factor transport system substrate-specific component
VIQSALPERAASRTRFLRALLLIVSLVFGLALLLYPFLLPVLATNASPDLARSSEMPLMISALVGLCLLVLLLEFQQQAANTRLVALLGILVAINSALRFLEVGIPGPGGFTPIFVLIILTGYVFGGSFGFLMGALTMLISALITGGVGPWLPGQMLTHRLGRTKRPVT